MGQKIRFRACAVIIQDGEVLLVQHQKYDKHYWLFPGGGVHFGETLEEAVIREMKEETNLDVEVGELIMTSESIPPDRHRHVVNAYFTAKVVGGDLKVGDDKYLFDVKWHRVEDLPRLTVFPNVTREILQWHETGKPPRLSLGNRWD